MQKMTAELYLIRGSKYDDPDPVRGISGGVNYTAKYVILGNSLKEAEEKFLKHVNTFSHYKLDYWEELKKGKEVGLEKRIKILGEVLSIIR